MVKNDEASVRAFSDPDETIEQLRERLFVAAHRANKAELNGRRLVARLDVLGARIRELARENEDLKRRLRSFTYGEEGDDDVERD